MKKNESFYIIGIFLMILRAMIENSTIIELNKIVDYAIILVTSIFFLIKILSEKYKKSEIIILAFLGCYAVYTSYICDYYAIAMSFLAIVGIKNVNITKVIKTITITMATFLSICFIVFLYNYLINPEVLEIYAITSDSLKRYYIYFKNPNLYAALTLWTIAGYLYLNKNEKKMFKYFLSFCISILTYKFTGSRTSLFLSLMLIICTYICNNKDVKSIIYKISKYLYIIFAIFSISIVIFYNQFNNYIPQLLNTLDIILSRRITLSVLAYNHYGLHILPNPIENLLVTWGKEYTTYLSVDNAYIKALVNIGLPYIFIINIMIKKAFKKKFDNFEYFLIILMSIGALFESYIYSAYICFPILILADKIFNKNAKEDMLECEGEKYER